MIFNNKNYNKLAFVSLLFCAAASAEMQAIDDNILAEVDAQNGLSLTGSFDLNTRGGPMWDYNRDGNGDATTCNTNNGKCGARFAMQTKSGGGWLILDDVRGAVSFEGLEVSVKTNTTATSNGSSKGVLELKLPSVLEYDNFNFTIASGGSASNNSLQTNFISLQVNGPIAMEGKLLVFP
jgi:hypothetical protein